MVFASRYLDGLYSRPFIAYVDERGDTSKPVLVAQDNINYYQMEMKSFNIPVFVKGEVKTSPYELSRAARSGVVDVKAIR